jgi:UDP-GlcNAc:undecaprenyl-phosphate/decaprenyl-phosphate GlcNAc-1-phosphate transferase
VLEYLLTILTAAIITYLLTPAVRLFAIWFGAQAPVRDRDVHAIPTPRLGGLAMFGGLIGALLVSSRLPKLSGVFQSSGAARGLLLASALIVVIGIADDRWELDALTKFAGQVAAAGLLIMNGVQLLWLPMPNGVPLSLPPEYGVPLTVFIVVATINAVNFVDGLDGLAAGTVGIAACALFSYSYLLSATNSMSRLMGATLITAILIGVCLGFLPHNFNPARIFMGDTGSMLIGLLLASSTIMLTGQFDTSMIGTYDLFPVFVPILLVPAVVAIPFMDMVFAVWRRANQGRSPFAPDKLHLHHRLLDLGHSHRRAVLIMYFWVGLLASCVIEFALAKNIGHVLSLSRSLVVTVSFSATCLVAALGVVAMIALPRIHTRRAVREVTATVHPLDPARQPASTRN